jgi:hypothetical protein
LGRQNIGQQVAIAKNIEINLIGILEPQACRNERRKTLFRRKAANKAALNSPWTLFMKDPEEISFHMRRHGKAGSRTRSSMLTI